jgi:hypothetical protein
MVGMHRRALIAVVLFVVIAGLAMGCSPARQQGSIGIPEPPTLSGMSVKDEAAIYVAAIRQIANASNPPKSGANKAVIYVVRGPNDNVVNLMAPPSRESTSFLTGPVQVAISAGLAPYRQVRWVNSRKDVELLPGTGAVKGGGAIVEFGHVARVSPGKVQVPVGIYYGNVGASGATYVIEKVDGVWKVTGNTGSGWNARSPGTGVAPSPNRTT